MNRPTLSSIIVFTAPFVIYFYILFTMPEQQSNFFIEFMAGALGVLLAFYLDRSIEKQRIQDKTGKIINNLVYELTENLEKLKIIRMGEYFDLFQTTSWEMWNDRIELDNLEILFDLSSLYHKFELYNEAQKVDSGTGAIQNVLDRYPKFYFNLRKEIDYVISRLNNE